MRLCFSRRVLARARTLSYVTEQSSAKTPKRRELSPLNGRESMLFYVIARSKQGPPKILVLLGIRNKQAKDKQLSLVAIVWLKAQFMTRDVAISRKGNLVKLCPFPAIPTLRSE